MTDQQELVVTSVVGPAAIAAAVFLTNRLVPTRLKSAWRTSAAGLLFAAAGFFLAVNVAHRLGLGLALLGILLVAIGMFVVPEDQ